MIVKRKLFSFIDEDGNLGYYLYNESTGEEKLFSVGEEEREYKKIKVSFGRNGGTKEIAELSDKQLENIAAYDNLTKDEKKNIIFNTAKYAVPLTIGGSIIGTGLSNNKKLGAVIGAGSVGGSMAAMAVSGHKLHKKQAKAAKKELEERKGGRS